MIKYMKSCKVVKNEDPMRIEESNFFRHGAKFVRADFHLHTKADRHFKFTGNTDYFVSDYVNALKCEDIRIGVVTNHNSFDVEEFRTIRRYAAKNDILILPGVELSVNDGANGLHMLVVFSEEWIADGSDMITPAIQGLFPGRTAQAIATADERTQGDLLWVVARLNECHKDYFIVAAHVDQSNGILHDLRGGRLKELESEKYSILRKRLVGFQKVRTAESRAFLENLKSGWRPAKVEGSDPKSMDEVGKPNGGSCYVKVGSFSFAAVAFALQDPIGRVREEELVGCHSHILSVKYEGGILNGITIPFSDEMNALIGIRGSGKSAIIETIRYALEIGSNGLTAEPDREYKSKLVDFALGSGGKVIVTAADRFGQQYRIERINREARSVIYLKDVVQPGLTITESIITHPVYFGQKDLSGGTADFEGDLIEKLIGARFDASRRRIAECAEAVRAAAQQLNAISADAEYLEELKLKRTDLKHQLEAFKAANLEEKLEGQLQFQTQSAKVAKYREEVDAYIDALDGAHSGYGDIDAVASLFPDIPEVSGEWGRVTTSIKTFQGGVAKSILGLRNEQGKLAELQDKIEAIRKDRADAFAAVLRSVSQEVGTSEASMNIRPGEFVRLREKLSQTEQAIGLLEKKMAQGGMRQDALTKALVSLNEARQAEFQERAKFLGTMNTDSIQIELLYRGRRDVFLSKLRELVRGAGVRTSTLEGIVDRYQDFSDLYLDLEEAQKFFGSNPKVVLDAICANLTDVLTFQVPDSTVIRYHGKPLKEHSLGQRASALMMFVLMQEGRDLVMIDQPEDDLDNQTIYRDIIKFLRQRKESVQYVFATHNPNIPVLGDAEQVVSCGMYGQKGDVVCGSLDSPDIRKRIVSVMEGGKEAFARRKEIYSLWN